jgi:hypothetical protein
MLLQNLHFFALNEQNIQTRQTFPIIKILTFKLRFGVWREGKIKTKKRYQPYLNGINFYLLADRITIEIQVINLLQFK